MDYSEERRDRLLMSDRQPTNPPIFKRSILKLAFQTCLVSLLFVSTIISLSLAWLLVSSVSCSYDNHSTYVGLRFDTKETLHWNTKYSSKNETLVDNLWERDIPWESGIIALTEAEARRFGLPDSQPFPWDPQEKRIYIVNAHHILHCVRNLYISIQEYRQNKPQSITYPHILHCLDNIRIETMCAADDTPRYVPVNSIHGLRPGDGQERRCRDWNQLQSFVQDHDPCYKYICPGDESISNLERFKYCANDSPYLPKIREHFGLGEDWKPWPHQDERICGVR